MDKTYFMGKRDILYLKNITKPVEDCFDYGSCLLCPKIIVYQVIEVKETLFLA